MTDQQRQEMVDFIVTNCAYCDEDDRTVINELTDEKLAARSESLAQSVMDTAVANAAREALDDSSATPEMVANALLPEFDADELEETPASAPAVNVRLTEEQWLEHAPESIREVFAVANDTVAKERGEISELLTANLQGEEKTKLVANLQKMSITDLRTLAVLAPKNRQLDASQGHGAPSMFANFTGLGDSGGPSVNSVGKKVQPMALPGNPLAQKS